METVRVQVDGVRAVSPREDGALLPVVLKDGEFVNDGDGEHVARQYLEGGPGDGAGAIIAPGASAEVDLALLVELFD